jgi:hypothetical protein
MACSWENLFLERTELSLVPWRFQGRVRQKFGVHHMFNESAVMKAPRRVFPSGASFNLTKGGEIF